MAFVRPPRTPSIRVPYLPPEHPFKPQITQVSELIAHRVRPKSQDFWQSLYDRSKNLVPRTHLARSLENVRNQFRNCTFHPDIKSAPESLAIVHQLQRIHTNLDNYFDLRKRQSFLAAIHLAATSTERFPTFIPKPAPVFKKFDPDVSILNHLKRLALAKKLREEKEINIHSKDRKRGVVLRLVTERSPIETSYGGVFGPFPKHN